MGIKEEPASSETTKSSNVSCTKSIPSPLSPNPSSKVELSQEKEKPRILAIDDDEAILSLFSRILGLNGYQVECASNGQEALAKIQDADYDVMICNVSMPVMDGLTFYRELVRTSPDLATRVVFCTGAATPEIQSLFFRMGRDVLLKPFQIEELHRVVERVLNACSICI